MPAFREAVRATLRGASIFYESRGRGRPVFLLHGSPGDHARARVLVEPAFRGRTGWRRIYPDLPGHGRSPGSPRIRDLDDYLDVLLEFVDTLVGQQRFALGGISFGAYLALAIARRRRSRVEGLLLSVPEVNHSPLEERRDRAHGTPSIQVTSAFARGLPRYTEDTEWLTGLPFRDVSVPLYRGAGRVLAPALFLLGRQDAPFRYRTYWDLVPDFPRATFALLDGASHRLWEDRNALAAALVGDWLDRVEASARAIPPRRPAGRQRI